LNFLHINETINRIEEPDTSHSLRSIDAECDQADLSRPFWLDQVVIYPTTIKPSGGKARQIKQKEQTIGIYAHVCSQATARMHAASLTMSCLLTMCVP